MPIWALEPLDWEDPNWKASTYRGQVIVRAENEKQARFLAAKAFAIAPHATLGQPLRITPWYYAGSVSCCQLPPSNDYSEEGEEGVLGPELATILATRPRGH